MDYQDRPLQCIDCHNEFMFTAGEQEFYDKKGFREQPKRCKPCREARKARREEGGGGGSRPRQAREMFDAVCASCGAPAQVPFRPTSGRPVYCRDCFASRSGQNAGGY
jgi:CxxC-x17-CxxC domain-containing protein